jgi:hypothetical protein
MRTIAALGLVIGAVFGIAGTFAPSSSLRGLAWGVDAVPPDEGQALTGCCRHRYCANIELGSNRVGRLQATVRLVKISARHN